tara:strand:+ start:2565 stop:3254 length:690 start_codon:yes stop_codon:yes gene_type:complete
MKKTLSFLIMSAVCLFTQNAQAEGLSLTGTLQYETEHYVRGLNYSDDALGVGFNGSYDLGWANAFGGVYNIPRLGGSDSINHSVLGLGRSYDLFGLKIDGSVEVQHHNAAVNSTEVGLGANFTNLPLISKFATVGLTLWDNQDLDYSGVTIDIAGDAIDVPFIDSLSFTPYVELGSFDLHDYQKFGSSLNYDGFEVLKPYVNVFYLDSDDSPFGDEDGWTTTVGVRYSF